MNAHQMVVVEQLNFHRRDDPANEYRELLLYQHEHHFSIWEIVGSLDSKDADWNLSGVRQRHQLHIGSESEMRLQLAEEAKCLREDGFTQIEPGKN